MKISLKHGKPPREVWNTICPICGITNLEPFKNAWYVSGYEAASEDRIGPKGKVIPNAVRRITKSVHIWACSKPCAEMAILQNL